MAWFREHKCGRCKRALQACICKSIERNHQREAARSGRPDPSPHTCKKCGYTVRGGVCPNADCG